MLGYSTESLSHTNLVNLAEKARRMPDFGLDTESDGPSLIKPQLTAAGNQSYKKFLDMRRSTTVGFSVAFADRTSYYVPLAHKKGNVPYHWGLDQLRKVLQEGKGRCGIHNLSHEIRAFKRLGIEIDPSWDLGCTQVEAWLTGMFVQKGDARLYGLKELSKKYLNHEMSTFEDVVGDGYFGLMDPQKGEAPQYACEDAIGAREILVRTRPIIKDWGIDDWYHNVELPFVFVLNHMTDTGIALDHDRAMDLYIKAQGKCDEARARFLAITGANLSSGVELQELFKKKHWPIQTPKGTKPVVHFTKKGKSGRYSTNAAAREKFATSGQCSTTGMEALDLLNTYQSWSKMASTYSLSLTRLAGQYEDGELHPDYLHTGTTTGRISSSYPNGMNMPTRGPIAKECMRIFRAPEGEIWGSADYSQIDLRVLSHFSGGVLQQAFKDGIDPHQQIADEMGIQRDPGKTLNFATVYGAMGTTLAFQLKCTKKQANAFQKTYMAKRPAIPALMRRIKQAAYQRGYVKTLSGRRRLFPNMPKRDQAKIRRGWYNGITQEDKKFLMDAWSDERMAGNTVCQGGAGDIVKKALVDIYLELPHDTAIQTMIHDDIRWRVYNYDGGEHAVKYASEVNQFIRDKMEATWKLEVPLLADSNQGFDWSELK